FLVSAENGIAIPLSPLMIWQGESRSIGRKRPELFLYDSGEKKSQAGYTFKAASSKESLSVGPDTGLGDLAAWLRELERDDRASAARFSDVSLHVERNA